MRTLTQALLRELLAYDATTGVFVRRVDNLLPRGGVHFPAGSVAGCVDKQYGRVLIAVAGKQYLAHRLAWLYVHGEWPSGCIDHIDGDASHNWISNLRIASKSENGQNVRKARVTSRSGVLGVWHNRRSGRWMAELIRDGRRAHLSSHETKSAAAAAYRAAKLVHHPFAPRPEG